MDPFHNYDIVEQLVADVPIPNMCKVRQHFDAEKIEDVPAFCAQQLLDSGIKERIKPGMRIAITAGSRGVQNIAEITRETVAFLKSCGAEPFIFPAMGSHGGATAKGQSKILEHYGITEAFCGCPISSSMEVTLIGKTEDGHEVYIDKLAAEADGIVAINRIKPHTGYRGDYESGLVKMLAIGMGKQRGADSLHQMGFGHFKERIPAFGRVIFEKCNVLFGIAAVENAFDETRILEVIPGEEIFEREPGLLQKARENMPAILLPEADVLVVEEIGKNYSGGGMDPNVSGRFASPFASGGLSCQRIAVLGLSKHTHGNFIGLGLADVTTKRAYESIDFAETYPNSITSVIFSSCKIPMVMRSDEYAIKVAIKSCIDIEREQVRIVIIKNTMDVAEILVSASLLDTVNRLPNLQALGPAQPLSFDTDGNITDLWR